MKKKQQITCAQGEPNHQIRLIFRKKIWFLLISNFVLLHFASGQSSDYEKAIAQFTGEHKYDIERPGALDGVAAPDFESATIEGKPVRLSELRGKVVVLNFWFIACPPCRIEVAPLNELVRQFKDKKDVVFLSIAREKEQDLKAHLQSTEFFFQTIPDPNSAIGNEVFHLFGYPTTIVIDKSGRIRYYALGGKIKEDDVRIELQEKLVPVIKTYLNER